MSAGILIYGNLRIVGKTAKIRTLKNFVPHGKTSLTLHIFPQQFPQCSGYHVRLTRGRQFNPGRKHLFFSFFLLFESRSEILSFVQILLFFLLIFLCLDLLCQLGVGGEGGKWDIKKSQIFIGRIQGRCTKDCTHYKHHSLQKQILRPVSTCPGGQTLDSTIHRINCYPLGKPLALSAGQKFIQWIALSTLQTTVETRSGTWGPIQLRHHHRGRVRRYGFPTVGDRGKS